MSERPASQRAASASPPAQRNVFVRYGVELMLLIGAIAAASVFILQPGLRAANAADTSAVSTPATSASPMSPSSTHWRSSSMKFPSVGRSPTRPIFGSLPFTDEERSRELKFCVDRGHNAATGLSNDVATSELAHTGIVGDSLAFDGVAHNLSSGRQIVWRCAIGNWDGRVGGSHFAALESINGIALDWNAIATIDDAIQRSCIAKAAALFTGHEVLPFTTGLRQSDAFTLSGVVRQSGEQLGAWHCDVRLDHGRITSLDVQQGPAPQ